MTNETATQPGVVDAATSATSATNGAEDADWEGIEREYRAGQLSNVAIAKEFGITEGAIRKRAKRDKWKKDLTERVKQAVRDELVRDAVRETEIRTREASDPEVVEPPAAEARSCCGGPLSSQRHQGCARAGQDAARAARDRGRIPGNAGMPD